MKSAIPKSSKVRHIARPFGWGKVSDVRLAAKKKLQSSRIWFRKKIGPNKNLLVGKFAKLLSEMFILHSCSFRGPKKFDQIVIFLGDALLPPNKKLDLETKKKNTPPPTPVVKGGHGLLIRCIMSNFQACNMTKSSCRINLLRVLAERWFFFSLLQKEGLFP